jgi:dienelactone hydrolase
VSTEPARAADPAPDVPALEGFSVTSFTHEGVTRAVYRGGAGPGVLLMHEIPGITPAVERLARALCAAGFTVAMPHLFGTPGKPWSLPYTWAALAGVCIRREFRVLASEASSPITRWLRALAGALNLELGGHGVGAIGLCLTGNFALALLLDADVIAPVLAQPSLPLITGLSASRKRALHLSSDELVQVRARLDARRGKVLGLRFTGDPLCPKERFEHYREVLGEAFEAVEIDSSPGNPHGIPPYAHSPLTNELVDRDGHPTQQALQRVLGFLRQELAAR